TGLVTNNATLNFSGSKGVTVGNIIIGIGSLTVNSGTNTLTAACTYTGTTTINGGILALNGSLGSGSVVTVAAAGTLSGTGTIGGTVTVDGTISPGSPSSLRTLACSSTVRLDGT